MPALYLTCGLCGRKQADGLLSRRAWGHLETDTNGTLCACPACKSEHADWEAKLVSTASGGAAASYGVGESTFA